MATTDKLLCHAQIWRGTAPDSSEVDVYEVPNGRLSYRDGRGYLFFLRPTDRRLATAIVDAGTIAANEAAMERLRADRWTNVEQHG